MDSPVRCRSLVERSGQGYSRVSTEHLRHSGESCKVGSEIARKATELDAATLGGTPHEQNYELERGAMAIEFRHDVDNVLKEAKEQGKPVLLDFSAAPM